ncbi:[protein-PII] uridylyltransferase [Nocardioides marmoribigeumensis]|uniref:Bifunctional uridylyltransferase/uridylyl-removing enzyme n=1 Tax=Nocardioides marmoribigeumensis TaxID=433649 RepID=A0ABU2BT65_9ACTN|nr:[protein-PII] uridylyltransferase [Nocardioides marmoribigeumensis]MDR7361466.1 [protein-PII] uridylyltransferase [Nocardioides marmoribigeumensis]
MTAADRLARTAEADQVCAAALHGVTGRDESDPLPGVALLAVGGYGRSELAPYSDLDLVLVHDEDVDVGSLAQELWYPLWDSGTKIDHAVRALDEVTAAARDDLRVALGLLDARHLAGDTAVSLRLRAGVLSTWRRDARRNLPLLRDLARGRAEQRGELAHASVPDLKESAGGLRDATMLKALVATWMVDVPHADLERSRLALLDVRDVLHEVAGRAVDRVVPEQWAAVAEALGLPDAAAAQRHVRQLGRRITHLSRISWRRVDRVLDPPPSAAHGRVPSLERAAAGVAVSAGEVVLDKGADPRRDPLLFLRAAVVAAERDLPFSPASVARLVRESAPVAEPWPAEARSLLVRLLASGRGLLPVWETLDETDALALFLPEWERIRLLPHASVVHRFTVDRHVVETCVEASRLIRRVSRPDLLMVGALLHDIGKGGTVEHSEAGAPIARTVARRWGFDEDDVEVVGRLVLHHLLLARVATTRDLDDPATAEEVATRVEEATVLDLLEVLTEADARATAPKAWTRWRAGLVADLAESARHALAGRAQTAPSSYPELSAERVEVLPDPVGLVVRVREPDRVGILADLAGTFLASRTPVVAARAWTQDGHAGSEWLLEGEVPDPAGLVRRVTAALDGGGPPAAADRALADATGLPAEVLLPDASADSTVMEVRASDRPGTLYAVLRALSGLDLSVRSAHVGSVGPQVVDVFYLQDASGGQLSPEAARAAAEAVRRSLGPADTLDA